MISPAFRLSLLASIRRSDKDCAFPCGLRLPKGQNLRTYHRWFARIGPVSEPTYHLPLSDRSLRRLFRFRLGAHSLPVEMGQRMAPVARICPLCTGVHVGDERHSVSDCPSFDDIRIRHSRLFDDSYGAMRLFMWHPHQKGVASCFLLQVLDRNGQLLTQTNRCIPSAMLAERTKFNFPSLPFPSRNCKTQRHGVSRTRCRGLQGA